MDSDPDTRIEVLAEHYQKTYEVTFELWTQRNRIFLVLLGVIGLATLLTFRAPQAESLLVDWIASILGVTEPKRIEELRRSFPYGLLQSILLVVVFYLIVNLYHRAIYVLRNYRYLERLENELRRELNLGANTVSFTREGAFYWQDRSGLLATVKWVYITLLGGLLIAFLIGRIREDFQGGSTALVLVDLGISIPIMVYYVAYALASISLDRPEVPQQVSGRAKGKSQ